MSNQVTMTQVAARAGVSRSAVSAAFSGRNTTVGLSAVTREQIHKAASELGYSPNILSRSFIKQRSYLIGMLGREAFFLFALETLKGIDDVLEPTDYSLLTFYHGDWADDQTKHLQKAVTRRVDGLIIVGAPEDPDGPNHRTLARLREGGTPIVQIYRRMFPDVPVVMMDDELTGYIAARHLIELGHQRIAHVTHAQYPDEKLPGTYADANRRCAGYVRAMSEAGLEHKIITFERAGYFGLGSNDYSPYCVDAAKQLVADRCTGVTTFNDYTAIGLIHNLKTIGISVPDEMSIVGYDNVEAGALMRPSLTTVRPRLTDIGRQAGEMILKSLGGQDVEDVVLEPELVIRGSAAACRLA